jgi:hypothetical protein
MRSGTIALAAVLVFAAVAVLAGVVGAGGVTANHSVGTPLKAAHPAPASVPTVGNLSNLSVSVTLTSAFPNYIQLPYDLTWSISVANGTWAPGNAWMVVQVRDVAAICQGILGLFIQCPGVVNIGLNASIASGTSTYNTTISDAALSAPQFHPGCPQIFGSGSPCSYASVMPNDQYQIYVFATVNNTVANVTGTGEATGYLITANPSAALLAPIQANSISTGNVSVAITYSGSYVESAGIAIYAGTVASSTPVYTQSLYAPGVGAQTVVAAAQWTVATPGAYLAVINITTPYSTTFFTSALTVVSAGGGIVYENTTTYQNSSGGAGGGKIFGLTTQVGGTVLLVVGLIIGMIVAFMLGMMMWGGTKAAGPAQPWQSKTTNECSVCHQSFATEQELKDHAKSAHGMS